MSMTESMTAQAAELGSLTTYEMVLVGASKNALTSGLTERSVMNGMVLISNSYVFGSNGLGCALFQRDTDGAGNKNSGKHGADKGPG